MRLSEAATGEAGLTTQHHQAILLLQGKPGTDA
jgi:hypothetical protein